MTRGRPSIHPREYVGRMLGDRPVTGYVVTNGRAMFLVTCSACGKPSKYTRGRIVSRALPPRCRCQGSAGGRPSARDYAAMVGTEVNGLALTAYHDTGRAKFALRCADGHVFWRDAWSVAHRDTHRCPQCPTVARERDDDSDDECATVPASVRPEVCDCAWLDGRQVRVCAQHRMAS